MYIYTVVPTRRVSAQRPRMMVVAHHVIHAVMVGAVQLMMATGQADRTAAAAAQADAAAAATTHIVAAAASASAGATTVAAAIADIAAAAAGTGSADGQRSLGHGRQGGHGAAGRIEHVQAVQGVMHLG